MQNLKLIQVLRTFSKDDWRDFVKFASSPYFNKGRNYLPLLKELKKFYPEFVSKKLTKENVYKKLFPGKVFKRTVLKTIFSDLHIIAVKFLIQKNIEKRNNFINPFLLNELSARKLKSHAESLIRKMMMFYASKNLSMGDFYDKMILEEEINDYYFHIDEKEKMCLATLNFSKYLICFFLREFIACERDLINNRNYIKSDFYKDFYGKAISCVDIEKLIDLIKDYDRKSHTLISMVHNVLMSQKHPENDFYYYELKSLAENEFDLFDFELKKRIYNDLNSICTTKINNGKTEFNNERFLISKTILSENLYYTEKGTYFSTNIFRGIVHTAIFLKKLDWLENFLKTYIDKIDPEFKEHILHESLSEIAFENGNYNEALLQATKIEQKQFIDKLRIKNLLSKIYYETNSIEPLYYVLDTYYHLLKNTSTQHKEIITRNKNFIEFLKNITNMKVNGLDNYKLKFMKDKLRQTKFVTSKIWLDEKLEELEKSV